MGIVVGDPVEASAVADGTCAGSSISGVVICIAEALDWWGDSGYAYSYSLIAVDYVDVFCNLYSGVIAGCHVNRTGGVMPEPDGVIHWSDVNNGFNISYGGYVGPSWCARDSALADETDDWASAATWSISVDGDTGPLGIAAVIVIHMTEFGWTTAVHWVAIDVLIATSSVYYGHRNSVGLPVAGGY